MYFQKEGLPLLCEIMNQWMRKSHYAFLRNAADKSFWSDTDECVNELNVSFVADLCNQYTTLVDNVSFLIENFGKYDINQLIGRLFGNLRKAKVAFQKRQNLRNIDRQNSIIDAIRSECAFADAKMLPSNSYD